MKLYFTVLGQSAEYLKEVPLIDYPSEAISCFLLGVAINKQGALSAPSKETEPFVLNGFVIRAVSIGAF